MRAQDSYEDRLKMVEMHDDVLARIDSAIKKKQSIEACWLCYACFESRITRTLEKCLLIVQSVIVIKITGSVLLLVLIV